MGMDRSRRLHTAFAVVAVFAVVVGVQSCSKGRASAAQVADALATSSGVTAASFLEGNATLEGRSVDSLATVRAWLFDDPATPQAPAAITAVSKQANATTAGKQSWAKLLTSAVSTNGRCSEATRSAVDGRAKLRDRGKVNAMTAVGAWIGSVMDSFAEAPRWFTTPARDWTTAPLPDSGRVLDQPWGNWWCLTNLIRTDPHTDSA